MACLAAFDVGTPAFTGLALFAPDQSSARDIGCLAIHDQDDLRFLFVCLGSPSLVAARAGDIMRITAATRASLGDQAFEAEFARGTKLTPEEAFALVC